MFLNSKYILANELVQKMGIHIANISILAKQFEDNDYGHVIKMNNCTFLNTKSRELPHNFVVGILANEFTDMSDKLPCTWVKEEFEMTEKEMLRADMIYGKVKVAGKNFWHFKPEFVKQMKGKIGYILNEEETKECSARGQIDGYVQLSKNKYFTWY